jgi:hypothetical protein
MEDITGYFEEMSSTNNSPSHVGRQSHSDDGDENQVPTDNSGLTLKIANEEHVILDTFHMTKGQTDASA